MFIVYAVYNKKHNKIYIGQTENIERRIALHNSGELTNSYTSRFDGGWQLIYSEIAYNRVAALIRERQLKSHKGRDFVKKYIPR